MSVTCWILLTSSVILWISKVVISADFYSLARSHQNDSPSWEQLGTSFVENLNWLLISHVGINLKFLLWILNFLKIRYWCSFRNKTKGGKSSKRYSELPVWCPSKHCFWPCLMWYSRRASVYTAYLSHRGNFLSWFRFQMYTNEVTLIL